MESLSCDSFFWEALLICNVPEIRKNKKQNLRWVHSEHEIMGCDWQQYFFQEHPHLAATEGEQRQKNVMAQVSNLDLKIKVGN